MLPHKQIIVLEWQWDGVKRVLGSVFEAADAVQLQSKVRARLFVPKGTKASLDHLCHAQSHLVSRPMSFFVLLASLFPIVPL
jgi:hypothetical protein